jgi:hypothetical protein
MRIQRAARLTILVVGMLVAACSPVVDPNSPPAASQTTADPTPDAAFEALVAEAIELRLSFGLRADEAWVREVASDPGALRNYGVPLTPAEEAELNARSAAVHELAPILQEYGTQHPEDFAGVFIDQEAGGVMVVLFVDHLEEHGAAIAKIVRPGARIEIRPAPASEADLAALMNRVIQDEAALRGVGVFVITASADEESGTVEVGVSTERGDAQGLLAGRYGRSVVVQVIDPTGAFLKPRGTIVGRVTDPGGRGVAAVFGGEPLFGDIPMDSVGLPETAPDGTFRLEDQLPGRWRITPDAGGRGTGSTEVDLPPGGTVTVQITVRTP